MSSLYDFLILCHANILTHSLLFSPAILFFSVSATIESSIVAILFFFPSLLSFFPALPIQFSSLYYFIRCGYSLPSQTLLPFFPIAFFLSYPSYFLSFFPAFLHILPHFFPQLYLLWLLLPIIHPAPIFSLFFFLLLSPFFSAPFLCGIGCRFVPSSLPPSLLASPSQRLVMATIC